MGKKIKDILKNKDVGAIGIGALIIFIAMVLVAGIAASVLIQTSTTLEMQALKTGSQTTSEVSSGLMVESVEGFRDDGNNIEYTAVEIKARAGSPDIDLSETVIEISDSDSKYVLSYDSDFTNKSEVDGHLFKSTFYPSDTNRQTKFGIIVLQDADGSLTAENPIINFGDHVAIAIGDAFGGIAPRTDVFGMVISEEGAPGIIGFRTPESYTDKVMELQ
jgi:archaeal flagellin FlaB